MTLPSFTPEQRAANLEKARQARIAKKVYKEAHKHLLKLDYLDSNHWATLASKYKVRMPSNEEQVDTSCIRKYLNKLNIPVETWNDHYTSMKYFIQQNATWTKYAAVGLVLELKESLK